MEETPSAETLIFYGSVQFQVIKNGQLISAAMPVIVPAQNEDIAREAAVRVLDHRIRQERILGPIVLESTNEAGLMALLGR